MTALLRRVIAIVLSCLAPHALATAVWVAGVADVARIDASSGVALKRVALAAVKQLAATTDGGVWALTAQTLTYVGAGEQPPTTVDIATLGYGDARLLAADPYDHGAWIVTAGNLLAHFDTNGRLQDGYTLPGQAAAMGMALDQTLWVAGSRELWQLAAPSRLLASVPFGTAWNEPVLALAVDSLADRVWLIGRSAIARIASNETAAPMTVIAVDGEIRGSALDAKTGRVWLLVGTELIAYDSGGQRVASMPLDAIDADDATALAYDGANDVLMVTAPGGVRIVDRDGGRLAAIALPEANDLGAASPFHLLPGLSLLRPPEDASTAKRQPEFILQLESLCSGVPCTLPPGYLESLRLIASLDGESIASGFRFDAITGQSTFVPSGALPLGSSLFSAQAVDRFGHHSNTVESRLTVLDAARSAVTLKANQLPIVTLTAPANNTTIHAGDVLLTATASDPDGTIAKVDFIIGSRTTSVTTPPYTFLWTYAPAGTYKISAKATDNLNGTRTSAVATVTLVNDAPTISITSPATGTVANGPDVTINVLAHDTERIWYITISDGATEVGGDTYPAGTQDVDTTFTFANLSAGAHALKATVHDQVGGVADATINITINAAPYVVITAPANCSILTGPANVTVSADALDTDGSVARVDFYQGSTLLGTLIRPPYTLTWPSVPLGSYTLTAVATDDRGVSKTSAPVTFSVMVPDVRPTVALTSPADGVTVGVGAPIPLVASASDSDGTVTKVEFYAGTTLVGTATSAPYTGTWKPAAAGSYTITAKATDNRGVSTISNAARVTVLTNKAPTVTLTAPRNGTKYIPPATINLAATASDTDGTIAKVEFYAGTTLVASATQAPFTAAWTVTAGGTYSLTAKATDNLGGVATSSAVSISVATPPQVAVTTPADNSSFPRGAAFYVEGQAVGFNAPIRKIELFVASGTGSPSSLGSCTFTGTGTGWFALSWCYTYYLSFPPGNYAFTAKATDSVGASAVSTNHVTVNSTPTVALTAPVNGSSFVPPATVDLAATATQQFGTISKVEFYADATLIGSATAAPYTATWANVPAGTYSITAQATDSAGSTVTSAAANISVGSNAPPTVSLTAPANGASYFSPATVTLNATASDSDGTIARVEFYAGATLIGTATSSPYTATWANVAGGSYALTAKAIDNQGGVGNSSPVSISVDTAPGVSITSPASNSTFAAYSTIPIVIHATEVDGTIAKVELLDGRAVVIATGTPPPGIRDYTFTVTVVSNAPGTYVYTARATDDLGAVTVSAPVTVIVNAVSVAPIVTLASPVNNAVFSAPATLSLAASATSPDGTAITRVEFYQGATLIGTIDGAGPWNASWANVVAGSYTITALAYNASAAVGVSAPARITVGAFGVPNGTINQPPSVVLTSPTNAANFPAPSNISLAANATDPDGTISRVEYYQNGNLIGAVTAAPWSASWNGVGAGSYKLTALAYDNVGAATTSAPVYITVGTPASVETITYLHNDFAGNAVAATDASGAIVWKEVYKPFGERTLNQPAAENNRQGFAGKPYDADTGLAYFGARYHDPVLGRFMGVDPKGVDPNNIHSFNRYAYGNNNPYKYADPDGRAATLIAQLGFEMVYAVATRLGAAAVGGWIGVKLYDLLHSENIAAADQPSAEPTSPAGDGRKPPSPNGRKGGKEHQDGVADVVEDVGSRDLEPRQEVHIRTPGGKKENRYADVGAYDADGKLVEVHQVGKQTKGGRPVSREREAQADMDRATGIDSAFHPYK